MTWSEGDPLTPTNLNRKGPQPAFNAKDFGAVGDGSTDDTAAIQSIFNTVVDGVDATGIIVFPPGDYRVTDTITVGPAVGLVVRGSGNGVAGGQGTRIRCEIADASQHLFDVSDTRQCRWSDFHVIADQKSGGGETVDAIFRSANNGVTGAVPTANIYENIRIEGQGSPGGFKRGWFFDGSGSAGNQNNDLNTFYNCRCQNPTEEGWLIDHNQSKSHSLFHCTSSGGNHVIRASGSYRFYGGGGGGATSSAAFRQEAVTDNLVIDGFNLENCDRLFELTGTTSAEMPVVISGGRFATGNLNADGDVVVMDHPGPLVLEGNYFSSNNPVPVGINLNGGVGARVSAVGNHFGGNSAGDSIISGSANLTTMDIEVAANTFASGTSTEFADGDTTPSVQGARIWHTANTGATTITDFDDGFAGKKLTVLVKDGNTTFQHGSGLDLDGNSNFSASDGDRIAFVFDNASGDWLETWRTTT